MNVVLSVNLVSLLVGSVLLRPIVSIVIMLIPGLFISLIIAGLVNTPVLLVLVLPVV